MSDAAADWTTGHAAIVYQVCAECANRWPFDRPFCPQCGSERVARATASGRGTVYTTTTVMRAPSAELRAYAPYTIVLVDAAEGFRLMAHGEPGLRIGDAVQAGFRDFAGTLVPYFESAERAKT
ncbi:MAG: OB-fold domain-containing protein [Candidatus Velthaea sp.]